MIRSSRLVLAVVDLQRATHYFTDVLGFHADAGSPPGWSFISLDGFRAMLGECPDAMPAADTQDHSYVAHLIVDDVDARFAAFKARGATFAAEIADQPWGHRQFCVLTPDGHRLLFAQPAQLQAAPVLDAVNLVCRDVAAAVEFYRLLGLAIEDDAIWKTRSGAHHVVARMPNGASLELDSPALAQRYNAGWREAQGTAGRGVIGFQLPDRAAVDACHARMTGAGYRAAQPPYDAFWGARYAIIEDPDGNHVGIMSPSDAAHRTPGPDL
jgi:catechol 2,3-dioxygenase-like lactoylglutathione lyase family enzyme